MRIQLKKIKIKSLLLKNEICNEKKLPSHQKLHRQKTKHQFAFTRQHTFTALLVGDKNVPLGYKSLVNLITLAHLK